MGLVAIFGNRARHDWPISLASDKIEDVEDGDFAADCLLFWKVILTLYVLLAVPWVLDIECRYCVVVQSTEGGYLYLARDEDMACDQALLVAASLPRECISVECLTALDYCRQY